MGIRPERNLPAEPKQSEKRLLETAAEVPSNALYMAFLMPGRMDPLYHAADLMSDILGRGKSSRLYASLVEEKKLFNSLSVHVTGSTDPGLLMIEGKTTRGVGLEEAEAAVWELIHEFKKKAFSEAELAKVKNKAEATVVFSELELLNRAMNLAFAANLGNPDLVNIESELIQAVKKEEVMAQAESLLKEENASVLRYASAK